MSISLYRSLTKLHEYVDAKTKIKNLVDLKNCQQITWEFLCNEDLCVKKKALDLSNLCQILLDYKIQVKCAHCRFRKTVFIFKALARTKLISKDARMNKIVELLHLDSELIVAFCMDRMKEKLREKGKVGESCLTGPKQLESKLTKPANNEVAQIFDSQPSEVQQFEPDHECLRVQPYSKLSQCLIEIDKSQLNNMYSSLSRLSYDEQVHCFIRNQPNPNGNEWAFSYTSKEIPKKPIEFLSKSETVSMKLDYTKNIFSLLKVFYENHEIMNNTMLTKMLKQVSNFGMGNNDLNFDLLLRNLAIQINTSYRGLMMFLTGLGSWSNGFMYSRYLCIPDNPFTLYRINHHFNQVIIGIFWTFFRKFWLFNDFFDLFRRVLRIHNNQVYFSFNKHQNY